jgi:hypothetical protein
MRTLLLSAPQDKNTASVLHRDFGTILNTRVGPEYAIYGNLVGQIVPGMKVVVFDRATRRQAEGIVADLQPTGNSTGGGVLRYNVLIRDLSLVDYTEPPHVNRCGVGFA